MTATLLVPAAGQPELRHTTLTEVEMVGRRFLGYAGIYNSIADLGGFTESVVFDAFGEVLSRQTENIPFLFEHDGPPMATWHAGTLKLAGDTRGLHVEVDLIEQRIKASIHKGREAAWEMAEALYEFDEEMGWLALGYESLAHWLADPEISMKRATYYRYVKAWQELVARRQLDVSTLRQLDPSKVEIVLPAIKRGEVPLDKALDDVRSNGARDLREVYSSPNGHPKPDDESDGEDMPPVVEAVEEIPVEEPEYIEQEIEATIDLYEAITEAEAMLDRDRLHLKVATKQLIAAAKAHLRDCPM